MNELKQFKERKQIEWRKEGLTPESMDTAIYLRIIETGNKFISDLIDGVEKAIPKNKSDKYTIQDFLTNLNS